MSNRFNHQMTHKSHRFDKSLIKKAKLNPPDPFIMDIKQISDFIFLRVGPGVGFDFF